MFNNAIILSGGEGTRMKPLTNYIPKALVEVNGKPLINGIIFLLEKYNINEIYLTYNYLSEILFKNLKHKVKGFINTTNNDNSYFLFNSFVKLINEPIIVIPCDLIVEINFDKLYQDYMELGQPAIMLIPTNPKNGIDGDYIFFDGDNIIKSLDRKIISKVYCSGIQIINPYKVNLLCEKKNNFYDVWKQLIGTNNIKVSNVQPNKWDAFDKINQII